MEKGSVLGLIVALGMFMITLVIAADFDPDFIVLVWDLGSVFLVVGGAFGATMVAVPFPKFKAGMKAAKIVFKPPALDPGAGISQIIALANTARKEGVLALEDSASNMEDQFLKKGIMLIVDGTDPELVKNIMDTEMSYIEERHGDIAGVYDMLGTMAPAWGMKGTLIALIMMLADLTDAEALGGNMALALITTLYGALMANAYALPFANKLKQISKEEILLKTIMVEGMLSIQAGENPRIIEEKLKSFLSPVLRESIGEGAGGGGGGDE